MTWKWPVCSSGPSPVWIPNPDSDILCTHSLTSAYDHFLIVAPLCWVNCWSVKCVLNRKLDIWYGGMACSIGKYFSDITSPLVNTHAAILSGIGAGWPGLFTRNIRDIWLLIFIWRDKGVIYLSQGTVIQCHGDPHLCFWVTAASWAFFVLWLRTPSLKVFLTRLCFLFSLFGLLKLDLLLALFLPLLQSPGLWFGSLIIGSSGAES